MRSFVSQSSTIVLSMLETVDHPYWRHGRQHGGAVERLGNNLAVALGVYDPPPCSLSNPVSARPTLGSAQPTLSSRGRAMGAPYARRERSPTRLGGGRPLGGLQQAAPRRPAASDERVEAARPPRAQVFLLRGTVLIFGVLLLSILSRSAQRGAWDSEALARHAAHRHGAQVLTVAGVLHSLVGAAANCSRLPAAAAAVVCLPSLTVASPNFAWNCDS